MLKPKKSLGQNFLQDENVLRKIADAAGIAKGDAVLEIGPGTGALTKHLVGQGASLTLVEIDDRAAAILQEQFGSGVQILRQDILNLDLRPLGPGLNVVGNIPYYITTEILFHIFSAHASVRTAVLMMQSEVAHRLVAKPRTKEYGILTVLTEFYAEPHALFDVSRNAFFPRPNVDSTVVRIDLKPTVAFDDEVLFRNVVRTAFGQRRKTLKNALSGLDAPPGRLAELPFDLTRRAEELTAADFIRLADLLVPFRAELKLPFRI